MRKYLAILIALFFVASIYADNKKNIATIYVDKEGVMRWSDTKQAASFYGVNYTTPFAHAYRVLNYLEKDHKKAIDKDVYHFARLGFNAYRIHIWDVEISDAEGNLLENQHLDLLDYLIAKLEERGIRVFVTTMTNFGNGYPERNENTGAFSYLYNKCKVHDTEEAIQAQERYIGQLIKHVNPYTGSAYKDDPYIVAFEINNEPCHSESPKATENYINRMLKAIKKTGNSKPVFYNVSHNMEHTQAYYNTAIEGTTYQWYPIGLVAGHTRKGNFLPYVDEYKIPFANLKNFDKKAKAVYEYDPADITYSYMYPAMTRTFRSQGFQWITQFAYDPMDIAWANTEYQTHFLNLAYTPQKAISMKIAAEVAYAVPMFSEFPAYPQNKSFNDFRVSYEEDLSEMNSPEKFFYSNQTNTVPVDAKRLSSIAGFGNSPIISYEGRGAYFLDKLEDGVWRLEVMPDAIQIKDPFEKASLKKEVVTIAWNTWKMNIDIPDLGGQFLIEQIDTTNKNKSISQNQEFEVAPGVYLLHKTGLTAKTQWQATTKWNNITLGEYVAPQHHANTFSVVHEPIKVAEIGSNIELTAEIVGPHRPDSVIIYTDKVSFWSETNPYIKMEKGKGYTYTATIPAANLTEGVLKYNIIVCDDTTSSNFTFPGYIKGNPLDWDFYQYKYWETKIVDSASMIRLINNGETIETYGIPETSYIRKKQLNNQAVYSFENVVEGARFFWRKHIKQDIIHRHAALESASDLYIEIQNPNNLSHLKIGFITSDGFTYATSLELEANKEIYKVSLSSLKQDATALLPHPYPSFLEQYFTPSSHIPFELRKIESIEVSTDGKVNKDSSLEIGEIWIK